jgi:polyhydroxyalkanoate synthesis regulator phasin
MPEEAKAYAEEVHDEIKSRISRAHGRL